MEDEQAPQEQPTYQQQYPQQYQQPYPYQYYYPPPKKDDKKLIYTIIAIVIVVMVLPTVMAALLYLMVIGTAPNGPYVPYGQFEDVEIQSNTSASVILGYVGGGSNPLDLRISVVTGSLGGTYSFPSHRDGTVLTLVLGSSVGTITYKDYADNGRINAGDELRMTNLTPGSYCQVRMIWDPTGDQIAFISFTLPG